MTSRFLDSLKVLLGRRRFEREMDDELRAHLDFQTDDLIRRGIPPAEARRRARAAFGAIEGTKEAARAARGVRWATSCWETCATRFGPSGNRRVMPRSPS